MFAQLLMVPIAPSVRQGEKINLTAHSVLATFTSPSPGLREAGFIIRSDGKLDLFRVTDFGGPPVDPTDEWVDDYPNASYASDYECQVTEDNRTGGGTLSGPVGTVWIDCAISDPNRDWSISSATAVDGTWALRVKLRHKISLVEYAEAVITLTLLDAVN